MMRRTEQGQANLTAIVILVGLIISAVWIWKRLSPETQEFVIDQAIPLAAAVIGIVVLVLAVVKKIRRRAHRKRERDYLLAAFQRETVRDKQLELSFALAEVNDYRVNGLEAVAPALKDLWVTTLRRALGDKQHRIRGMAASHLGILNDLTVVPLLLAALEDDHAYVRACAALGLGRLRAPEARAKLEYVMKEDWDQTVRSRAKEALERIPPP
ncbi:HEAT repeat domain-containing protein [Nitrospira sp. NS4]|uniref:HEAT repeat domain-containing protein n=1 Tax=Nitrospira sp. NS4 TaxID=3414498 RepID=UPI003C2CD44E